MLSDMQVSRHCTIILIFLYAYMLNYFWVIPLFVLGVPMALTDLISWCLGGLKATSSATNCLLPG